VYMGIDICYHKTAYSVIFILRIDKYYRSLFLAMYVCSHAVAVYTYFRDGVCVFEPVPLGEKRTLIY
jgi:hypothetical protein